MESRQGIIHLLARSTNVLIVLLAKNKNLVLTQSQVIVIDKTFWQRPVPKRI